MADVDLPSLDREAEAFFMVLRSRVISIRENKANSTKPMETSWRVNEQGFC